MLCYNIFYQCEIICELNQKNEYVTALFLIFADVQSADTCTPAQFYRYGNNAGNRESDSDGIDYVWKMDPMTSADILYDLMNTKRRQPAVEEADGFCHGQYHCAVLFFRTELSE